MMVKIEGLSVIQKAEQYDILMNLVREKVPISDTDKKIQLLTLGPQTCPRFTLAYFFGVSDYLVRESRQVFKTTSILGEVAPKKGKKLPIETVKIVESFYQNDEYTRQMPGKKVNISIGRNIHIQKRLILCNLKELFTEFKTKYPIIKISFSKFCELRPKWCILADSRGTHSVCVCSIHQKTILLIDAADIQYTYKDLMSKLVCSLDTANCMIHRCEKCPGNDNLRHYLSIESKRHGGIN